MRNLCLGKAKTKSKKYVNIVARHWWFIRVIWSSDYSEVKKNQRKEKPGSLGQNERRVAYFELRLERKVLTYAGIGTGLSKRSALDEDDDRRHRY